MWADSLKLVARITAGLRGEAGTPEDSPRGLILSMSPLAYASHSGIDVGSPNPLEFLFMSPVEGHVGIPGKCVLGMSHSIFQEHLTD